MWLRELAAASWTLPPFLPRVGRGLPYPHGHADGAVHVAFVQPPTLGDAALLRAQGRRVLGEVTPPSGSPSSAISTSSPGNTAHTEPHDHQAPSAHPHSQAAVLRQGAGSHASDPGFRDHVSQAHPARYRTRKANSWKTSQRLSSGKGERRNEAGGERQRREEGAAGGPAQETVKEGAGQAPGGAHARLSPAGRAGSMKVGKEVPVAARHLRHGPGRSWGL